MIITTYMQLGALCLAGIVYLAAIGSLIKK